MESPIFRFMNVRPPQDVGWTSEELNVIDPHRPDYQTDLRRAVDEAAQRRDLPTIITLSSTYLQSNSNIASLFDIDFHLGDFDRLMTRLGTSPTFSEVVQALINTYDIGEPHRVVQLPHFRESRGKIADLLVSYFYVGSATLELGFLVRGIRLLEVVQRMTQGLLEPNQISQVLAATVIVPYERTFQKLSYSERSSLVLTDSIAVVATSFSSTSRPPVPQTTGSVKIAGIGDLLIVKQTLRRYEAGEIAHIENILLGESRERSHSRKETIEETLIEETETSTEIERDLQSTDRFELQNAASRTLQEDMNVQAGLTVTASYGSVQVTATGQFGYNRSKEESEQTASKFARDVTQRSVSRVRERVLNRREIRTQTVIEELNKHGFDNREGEGPIVGVYRWVDKIYDAQIVNYGKRMMVDFLVPEPAAYYRKLETSRRTSGLRREKPKQLNIEPRAIVWPDIQSMLKEYDVTGVEPPPQETIIIGGIIEVPYIDKEQEKEGFYEDGNALRGLGATKVATEIEIPEGYSADYIKWSGHSLPYVRKWPNAIEKGSGADPILWAKYRWYMQLPEETRVSIGSGTFDRDGNSNEIKGFTGKLPIAVITSAAGLVLTIQVVCTRTDALFQQWQLKVYEQILLAYQTRLQEYYDDLARLEFEQSGQIQGRNPASNREIEHTELKRASISILTAQHFDLFDALQWVPSGKDPNLVDDYPLIDFDEADAEGQYVQFFEQSFEWHNMTYVYYPYFWGRKDEWKSMLHEGTADPLFNYFLKAGYARVQVPIRPGFETMIINYLSSPGGVIWQSNDPANIPEPYLPIVKELRERLNDDFTLGEGVLNVTAGEKTITGTGTNFSSSDINREIRINRKVYVIREVYSPTWISLNKSYSEASAEGILYALGGVRIGDAWEVRLPTTLVILNESANTLPVFPED